MLAERRWEMSTLSHPPGKALDRRWTELVFVREMWASCAIAAMWIAVAIVSVWGGDFVSSNGAGTNSTTFPSGIVVAALATVGTWAVAKYGLRENRRE
jgi:hypothetical protein